MLFSIDDLHNLDNYLIIMEKWLQAQHEKAGLKQVHLWDINDSELLGNIFSLLEATRWKLKASVYHVVLSHALIELNRQEAFRTAPKHPKH